MAGFATVVAGPPLAAAAMAAPVPPAAVAAPVPPAAAVAAPMAPAAVAAPMAPAGTVPMVSAMTVGTRRLPLAADPAREEQWQLKDFQAETLWRTSTGKGVTVAVIDSGVDGSHPDLAGQVLPGVDLVTEAGDGQTDPVGHGTTVAGLIAGRRDDAKGVVGLAPDAKILPIRVLDEQNRYDDALIVAKGVRWAVENGAQVINLSLGGSGESAALAAALDYAFAKDVVVVACTGNASSSTAHEVWYPAREPGVVAVAGMERDSDELWSGSITGPEAVLTAPATGLLGARPGGGFWKVQGTSFATPLVTATAALVRARWPEMTAGDVVQRLISTARDLGPPGRDDRFGFGMVDPVRALNTQVTEVFQNPLDDDAEPPGVAGFGPAPGREQVERDVSAADRLGGMSGRQTRWVAQPAGDSASQVMGGIWGFGALLAVVIGASLVVIRVRNRRTPWQRVPAGREFFESGAGGRLRRSVRRQADGHRHSSPSGRARRH